MESYVMSDNTEIEVETETTTETSGYLTIDGESWKERNDTTYTSLLDMYSVSDLFSDENCILYNELALQNDLKQQELTEYIFSGQMQVKSYDEELVEWLFSEEIELSKVKSYDREDNDYIICIVMAGILAALIFVSVIMRFNANRKKRREQYALEIDMENERA